MIPFVRKYAAALAVLALSACQARAAGPQDPAAGSLTGRIASDDGTPLAGVVVSDGVRVTQTDAEGMYALNSDKELGYVFVSIPSGYMAAVDATAIPQFFAYTAKPAEESERHDFTLTPVENTRHTLIAATDHHLADRESLDVGQFTAEGKERKNLWFAGFYPAEDPQYTIVVLQDGQTQAAVSSAAVFAQLCTALHWLG